MLLNMEIMKYEICLIVFLMDPNWGVRYGKIISVNVAKIEVTSKK